MGIASTNLPVLSPCVLCTLLPAPHGACLIWSVYTSSESVLGLLQGLGRRSKVSKSALFLALEIQQSTKEAKILTLLLLAYQ